MQRFRGGLLFKAHRLCVSLNSRLESNKDEEGADRSTIEDEDLPGVAPHRHQVAVLAVPICPESCVHINVQRVRGGLVFEADRLCVSLNCRLDSNKEEEEESYICSEMTIVCLLVFERTNRGVAPHRYQVVVLAVPVMYLFRNILLVFERTHRGGAPHRHQVAVLSVPICSESCIRPIGGC